MLFSSASPEAGSPPWRSKSARADYARCVWFAETTIDCDTEAAFEREIGIAHPLCEILSASPAPCLIVFDSFERYSPRAQRLAHRWMQVLLGDKGPEHIHVLITSQIEPAPKLIRSFIEAGLPPALHRTTPTQSAVGRRRSKPCRANLGAAMGVIAARTSSVVDEPEDPRLAGRGSAQREGDQSGVDH